MDVLIAYATSSVARLGYKAPEKAARMAARMRHRVSGQVHASLRQEIDARVSWELDTWLSEGRPWTN